MCHFKDMSEIKKKPRLQNLLQGGRTGHVFLQQVCQCGMIFETDVRTDKNFQQVRGKLLPMSSLSEQTLKKTVIADTKKYPLPSPQAFYPIYCMGFFLILWICKSSCFIILSFIFSVSWKLVLQKCFITKILRERKVMF